MVGHVPETGTSIQRTTLNKPRRSTATRTSSRNTQGPPGTGSADTPTSNGTRVKTKKSTAVKSSQKSATVPKQIDVKVNLSNRDNTYVAPHSRAPVVSRANGNGGGLRTYSRIPLHLRGKTPGAADAVIDSTKSNHANIANREKISNRISGMFVPNCMNIPKYTLTGYISLSNGEYGER